jgi:hypothetical protein
MPDPSADRAARAAPLAVPPPMAAPHDGLLVLAALTGSPRLLVAWRRAGRVREEVADASEPA